MIFLAFPSMLYTTLLPSEMSLVGAPVHIQGVSMKSSFLLACWVTLLFPSNWYATWTLTIAENLNFLAPSPTQRVRGAFQGIYLLANVYTHNTLWFDRQHDNFLKMFLYPWPLWYHNGQFYQTWFLDRSLNV